ncbi:hypothetical protein F2Q68_00015355 [Brassica cretica]|uniref:Aspartic peptidase DDI1-type domain-containing protein n=1 Tax=Brassica cretica TaxID=69181 RepID=A0A8S9HUL7_BRACR|nr:hypothetical protein F2Q68_00015355 [Brassica cretica]
MHTISIDGNFFRESRETYEDIEQLFNKVCRKPKRTLKKEQDPGKFLIPCSIQNHDLPNALCDTGSAVSIMSIDTADLLGLKMEPSQDSFTFVDNSNANSAGMIRNIKVKIGDCTIPVDFHVLEIKSGKPSSLLFGRAFMAIVGAVCDLKKNMMFRNHGVHFPKERGTNHDVNRCCTETRPKSCLTIAIQIQPKRTLKKEQDPGKFLIPCSIQNHDLPNALCDTGSAVSIMSIDTADLLGLKMEPSQDSFTFVDNSNANSAGMIRNIKVKIGDCTIPVDFHVLEIKSGKPSSLLFGRAFMAIVGAVCDLKKNMMCLTNIDEGVYYDPVDKTRSKDFISCIELSDDEAHTADSTREPVKLESASMDDQPSASVDKQPSESIDTKLPASVDTLHISEQAVTEKSKSGGRTRQRKKKRKKNIDADFLALVPSQFQDGSLECRVRCRGGHEPFTKVLGKDLKKMSSHKNRRVMHQHQPALDHCRSTEHHKY